MKPKFLKAILSIFVFIMSCSISGIAQTTKETPQTTAQTLKTVKLKVSGITCGNDCKDIQKVVSQLNGVTSCKQKGKPNATSIFEVTFNPAIITEKEIRNVVEDTPGCESPDDRPYKVKQGK
jgi:copper chaperone CopZ